MSDVIAEAAEFAARLERVVALAEVAARLERLNRAVEVPAYALGKGDVIVETNGMGKSTRTVVARRERGCDRYHTHIVTVGGKNWCYDARMPVTVEP